MRKLVYSMGVSLDGYIAGPGGDFDWAAPDAELHQFHNDRVRDTDVQLCGRRLYETMIYWETAEENPESTPVEVDFARVWRETPKIVFSTTLDTVVGNATLRRGGVVEEVERLKAEPGGDIAVGGASLAAACIEAGLVDEFRVFVNPALAGGGTPFFPALGATVDLELVETRTFGSRVVYMRHRKL